MTKEQDAKLAEMIRNFKKDELAELSLNAQRTITNTQKACEEAATKIKPKFDFSELNKSMAKVHKNVAVFERTQANVKAVCDDLASGKIKVEIDTTELEAAAKRCREASAKATRVCENLKAATGDC